MLSLSYKNTRTGIFITLLWEGGSSLWTLRVQGLTARCFVVFDEYLHISVLWPMHTALAILQSKPIIVLCSL